ncbi:hypothetical protein CWC38_08245 [Kocuria tytonicola]|uniref:DNA-binding protein n=1 Tax=Kocuria tytonicola TaxID=2055946 RepID=A0A3L9LA70_9MICC|nr:hypothetical protein [Kocuria tytonicola]RLY95064.1 hypothetical protein EAE32_08180 [Kocuria tytonicola]RLZ02973.1 hypothetical protein CWC38_08245 [Kocuria tytonicola]
MTGNNPLTGAIDVMGGPEAAERDLTPSTADRPRRRAVVEGVVVEVTIAPVTSPPRFRALLKVPRPGSAVPCAVELLWHGQRTVPGVAAGTRLRCLAVLCHPDGVPTMYNPRYEIVTPKKVWR